ncbi:hypothetical protein PanWU01x14_348460, partial [Parasponia andersonii]
MSVVVKAPYASSQTLSSHHDSPPSQLISHVNIDQFNKAAIIIDRAYEAREICKGIEAQSVKM